MLPYKRGIKGVANKIRESLKNLGFSFNNLVESEPKKDKIIMCSDSTRLKEALIEIY